MNLIEKAVVAGVAVYILLMAAEIISHPAMILLFVLYGVLCWFGVIPWT